MNNSDKIYRKVLEEQITALDKEIMQLKKEIEKAKVFVRSKEVELLTLTEEKDRIEEELRQMEELANLDKKYADNSVIEALDVASSKIGERRDRLSDEIQELERERETASNVGKTKIDFKIKQRNDILEAMKKGSNHIDKAQHSIMMKQSSIQRLLKRKYVKQQATIDYYDVKKDSNEALRRTIGFKEDSIGDRIFQMRSAYFDAQIKFQEEVLEEMHNHKLIGIKGAKAMVLSKHAISNIKKIRDTIQKNRDERQQQMEDMFNTPEEMGQEAQFSASL